MNARYKFVAVALAGAVALTPGLRDVALETGRTIAGPVISSVSDEVGFLAGRDSDSAMKPGIAPLPESEVVSSGSVEQSAMKSSKGNGRASSRPGSLGSKAGATHYAFTARSASGAPARWNSCNPIRIVVNPAGAPRGAVADLRAAVASVKAATGLPLTIVGQTTAKSVPQWGSHKRAGYVGWAPVLVSWGHPGGALNEGASATTEPVWETNSSGQLVFVSGQLRINVEHDSYYTPGFGASASRVALYMHELGHVVGLEHVEDTDQLMNPSMGFTPDFGAGDLAGLKKAGMAGCVTVPRPSWK